MEETLIQRIYGYVISKSIGFWVRIVLLFLATVYVIYLVVTYTVIAVTVVRHDGITQPIQIRASSPAHDKETAVAIGDIVFVRRDSFSISVTADTYQTNKQLPSLPIIGVQSVSVDLYKDHDVKKYSGDSLGCIGYDQTNDTVISYSCGKPEYLVKYNRPLSETSYWENTVIAQMTDGYPPIYSLKPYRNGVLGLLQPPQSDKEVRNLIFYIDSSGKKQSFDIPPDVTINDVSNLSLITDTTSANNNRFLLVNTNGKLYLGDIKGSAVTYKPSAVANSYDPGFDALFCNLLDTTAYCYHGEGSAAADSHKENTHREHSDNGSIDVINISGGTMSSYALTKKLNMSRLSVSRSQSIYAVSRNLDDQTNNIYQIQLDNKSATPKLFLMNIASSASGDGFYYIKDNELYRVDDERHESYLVFSSPHLRLSNVIIIGDNVFINAFIKGLPDQKLHTYRLLSNASDVPRGQRLVDTLPFYLDGSMLDIDYADKVVRVRVFATATPDKSRNRLVYDEKEYMYNQSIIAKQLNTLGITADKYKIIYSK